MNRLKYKTFKISLTIASLISSFLWASCDNDNLPISSYKLLEQPQKPLSSSRSVDKEASVSHGPAGNELTGSEAVVEEVEVNEPEDIEPPSNKSEVDEPLVNMCETFQFHMREWFTEEESRSIEFASGSSLSLTSPKLTASATVEEKCLEIQRNFSGAVTKFNDGGLIRRNTKIGIKFEPTALQKERLLAGESIDMITKQVKIKISDGAYYVREFYADLNCQKSFKVKCTNRFMTAKDNCTIYQFDYLPQTCTFSVLRQPYKFSNDYLENINLKGELMLSQGETNLFIIKEYGW